MPSTKSWRHGAFCVLLAFAATGADGTFEVAGLPLGSYFPALKDCLLVAVTEIRTKSEIDRFAACLKKALA